MVKIEYHEEPRESFLQFDIMMSIASKRDQLMKGDTVNTGIKNTITIFIESVILFLIAKVVQLLLPEMDPLLSKILIGVALMLFAVNALLLAFSFYGYKENLKLGQLKADLIFDEKGIHAWEDVNKGFDIDWRAITHCFISKKHIYILFVNPRLAVIIPYTKENRDKMIEAMKIGKKLPIIKFVDIKRGVISVKNK